MSQLADCEAGRQALKNKFARFLSGEVCSAKVDFCSEALKFVFHKNDAADEEALDRFDKEARQW